MLHTGTQHDALQTSRHHHAEAQLMLWRACLADCACPGKLHATAAPPALAMLKDLWEGRQLKCWTGWSSIEHAHSCQLERS